MSPRASPSRPRPRSPRSGAFFVCSVLLASCAALAASGARAHAAGQVPDTVPPVPTDTIPPVPMDTVPPVPADTVPADTVPPEPPPDPAQLPPLDAVGMTGWVVGVWEWDRADLLRFPDLSLLHLLERIPGIVPVRVTSVGQPEAAAIFGSTAGAIRYEIDGFILDPLTSPTLDPSRFPLLALESVRVERSVTGATVRIRTVSPTDPRALSIIEAGTGDLRTNLFRGTFLAPHVLGGALALGFESLGGQTLRANPSNHAAGFVKWTWSRDETGIQVDFRQSTMDRTGVAEGLSGRRRDWAIRARDRFGPVTAELYAGGSSVEDDLGGILLREGGPQGGVRVRSELDVPVPVQATAALRVRSHPRLASPEVEVGAWSEPTPWLGIGAELVQGWLTDHSPTGHWSVRARAGAFLGLTPFAELSGATTALVPTGSVSGTVTADLAGGVGVELPRTGLRAGAEFRRGGLRLGVAGIRTSADSVPGFGLAFDPSAPRFAGGEVNGVEATVRLPTGWSPLWVEGWFVYLDAPSTWPYLPAERWRAALVYHHLPLPSGNLEIYARVEQELRGVMAVPLDGVLTRVEAYRATNVKLTIRVLTVHAFMRWQNAFHRPFQQDVPGFDRPGQHVVYGVKWQMWN